MRLHKFTFSQELASERYLLLFGKILFTLVLLTALLALPYSFLFLSTSGDVALKEVVEKQSAGTFALFGSGVSQDFVDYKLKLYAKVRPTIVSLGSSRVMQFRAGCFEQKFLNMGGVAGNLPVLRSTLDAMLAIHTPEAVILGLDFWWFLPLWNKDPFQVEPPTSGSYVYSLENLKKPWVWLLTGKLTAQDLVAPFVTLFGSGFSPNRYGIMAQQTDDGFGSDGSWYYTAELTGQKPPFDFQFRDTLTQVVYGTKAFAHAKNLQGPPKEHLDAFAEIYCRLQARGIRTFVFLPPLAETVYQSMLKREEQYPHLFHLANALRARGINVLDLSDPRKLGGSDCEFVDGFHGGEITYLRILRSLADHWAGLLAYVDVKKINLLIREWQGHAVIHDSRVTELFETDFMQLGCKKRTR